MLRSSCATGYLCVPTLFVYSAGAHRDLHSFPTRRSSDLNQHFAHRTGNIDFRRSVAIAPLRKHFLEFTEQRSEEHTSELQSRFDLVCRLLLEKKKLDSTASMLDSTFKLLCTIRSVF